MSDGAGGTPGAAPARRAPTSTWVAAGAMLVGAVLVVVGVARAADAASYGWFAYAPLSGTTFRPESPLLWQVPVLVGGGALLVGLGAGFLLGRRRRG